jgi:hypothetical protein
LGIAALSCAACVAKSGRPTMPGAAAQVRVDIAARALAQADERFEVACPSTSCNRRVPPYQDLADALSRAMLALENAQYAAARYERGDGRTYAELQDTFAVDLRRVADALRAVELDVPPGLCGVIAASPDTRCNEANLIE